MLNKNRGFTLIELLVVIAIIGILASVVIASLNTARSKGADAAVKANLSGMRSQAELFYDANNSSYLNLCGDSKIKAAIASAKSAAGITKATNTTFIQAGSAGTATCHANASGYAMEVPLKTTSLGFFCIDGTGAATTTAKGTTITGAGVTCG